MLKEQIPAPDFTLPDANETNRSLSDFKGKYVLLYFYPKDDTPGCTKEACSIRDDYGQFEKEGMVVIGISADSPESHKKFAEKYHLPFFLLSDSDKNVIKSYEAKAGPLTRRISYLIDPDGTIVKAYRSVDPASHAQEILRDVREIIQKK